MADPRAIAAARSESAMKTIALTDETLPRPDAFEGPVGCGAVLSPIVGVDDERAAHEIVSHRAGQGAGSAGSTDGAARPQACQLIALAPRDQVGRHR